MRPEPVGRKAAALTLLDPLTQRSVELDKILSRADLRGDHPQPLQVSEFAWHRIRHVRKDLYLYNLEEFLPLLGAGRHERPVQGRGKSA
jgi:hypothetical protein